MTSKLRDLLVEKYPYETENSKSSFFIYGAGERIYLNLYHKSFCSKEHGLINHEEIDRIARNFFNLFYEMRKIDKDEIIILNPDNDMKHREYDGHNITVYSPFFYPCMEISTGHRGNGDLTGEQRQKYFEFVKEIYEKFLENARKV
jgi:hypothetical protein